MMQVFFFCVLLFEPSVCPVQLLFLMFYLHKVSVNNEMKNYNEWNAPVTLSQGDSEDIKRLNISSWKHV